MPLALNQECSWPCNSPFPTIQDVAENGCSTVPENSLPWTTPSPLAEQRDPRLHEDRRPITVHFGQVRGGGRNYLKCMIQTPWLPFCFLCRKMHTQTHIGPWEAKQFWVMCSPKICWIMGNPWCVKGLLRVHKTRLCTSLQRHLDLELCSVFCFAQVACFKVGSGS